MLGDGTLHKVDGKVRNSRFDSTHGIKQYDWLAWKQKELDPLSTNLKKGESTARKRLKTGLVIDDPTRKYQNCSLRSIAHPKLTKLEEKWYKRDKGRYIFKKIRGRNYRIKIVPADLELDNLALATWFIDDGNNVPKKRSAYLYTLSFTESEVEFLTNKIRSLGFVCHKARYGQTDSFYIVIGAESYESFIKTVATAIPDLPDDLKYKIDLTEYKVSWKKSSAYHPLSPFDDDLWAEILKDVERKIPQREIAKKRKLNYKNLNRHLKGKSTLSKGQIKPTTVSYRSTTGITGVYYGRGAYIAQVALPKGDGTYNHLCLGYYQDQNVAKLVADEAIKMRDAGIIDLAEYQKMRLLHKPSTRRTNKSGQSGVWLTNAQKWAASITFEGTRIGLGTHETKEQAVQIRQKAEVLVQNGIKDLTAYAKLRTGYRKKRDLPTGICRRSNKYRFSLSLNGKSVTSASYDTVDECVAARHSAVKLKKQGYKSMREIMDKITDKR